MADTGGVSAGEVGGMIAGVLALLAAVGKGAQWLINWNDARAQTRSAKLQTWHEELQAREKKLDEQIEGRLKLLEGAHKGLQQEYAALLQRFDHTRIAFRIVASELSILAPHSTALLQVQAVLNEPLPVLLPHPEAVQQAEAIEQIDAATPD